MPAGNAACFLKKRPLSLVLVRTMSYAIQSPLAFLFVQGIGLLIGAVVGIPLGILVVYRVYSREGAV